MTDDRAGRDDDDPLRRASIELLVCNAASGVVPDLLVGALCCGFYSVTGLAPRLWLWWLVLAFVRLAGQRAMRRRGSAARGALLATLAASGLLWGIAPLLVAWLAGMDAAFAAILLAAGIAIAAFGSYGIDARAALLATLPIAVAIVGLALAAASLAGYAVAAAVPLLYAHQCLVAVQARRTLAAQIRRRVESEALAAERGERAAKATAELDRRLETERMLRASRDRAERLSSTDALTGIANRRYFDKRLRAEVSRAFRARSPLSLVLADLDYFKQYNDLYGHPQGDECLRAFAALLESYCRRGGDLAARVGGEEFALLLPETDYAAACHLAEQARAAFDAAGILHEGSQVKDNATASFGVASVTPDGLEAGEALLAQADAALYRAKGQGRNRVAGAAGAATGAAAAP